MYFSNLKIAGIIIVLFMGYISCNPNNEGKLPPPAIVSLVEKMTDMAEIEHGIDTVPERDGIFIEWYLLSDPDVTSYNIYRRSSDESIFSKITTIPVENNISPFDTIFSYVDDDNLVLDNSNYIYYYYVTASNRDDVEGQAPDDLTQHSYMLLEKPLLQDTQNINYIEQPVFTWSFQGGNIPNYYIIRIENLVTETFLWAKRFQNQDLERDKVKDLASVPNAPSYQSGSIYRWRIDAVGPDSLYSGSESNWKTFSVN